MAGILLGRRHAEEAAPVILKSEGNNARVTHLGAVQVLVFLQEFIGLLDGHFIVAIIEVIWVEGGETWEIMSTLTWTIRITNLTKNDGRHFENKHSEYQEF